MEKLQFYTHSSLRGIIRIYNIHSDKTMLISSEDVTADIQKMRFALDLGVFSNKDLQAEYEQQGLEVFVLEATSVVDTDGDLKQALQLEKERLQALGFSFYQD